MNTVVSLPDELQRKIDDINKELHPFQWKEGQPTPKLVPYLLDERTNDWRCHLLDIDGNTLASYLNPKHLQWHVVSMFLHGFQERRKIDFRAGQLDSVNKLHEHNQRILGLIR